MTANTAPPVLHGSFTLERTYPASPARVYAAFTDPERRQRWFVGPPERGWTLLERSADVRVGGVEVVRGRFADGNESRFVARYHALEPDRRVVYDYDMHYGGTFLSVSLSTVELEPVAGGTRLVYTEQLAHLCGEDGTASREEGTAYLFDRVAAALAEG